MCVAVSVCVCVCVRHWEQSYQGVASPLKKHLTVHKVLIVAIFCLFCLSTTTNYYLTGSTDVLLTTLTLKEKYSFCRQVLSLTDYYIQYYLIKLMLNQCVVTILFVLG